MEEFLTLLKTGETQSITSIERSIESHIMAYAAELSRTTKKTIEIKELKENLLKEE